MCIGCSAGLYDYEFPRVESERLSCVMCFFQWMSMQRPWRCVMCGTSRNVGRKEKFVGLVEETAAVDLTWKFDCQKGFSAHFSG